MSVFIVAELSGNHRGSLQRALDLVYSAKAAGADAIKLQTMHPDRIAAPGVRIGQGPWAGRELRELYAEAMTPWEWHGRLFDEARELGMEAFSSPFDPEAVAFLDALGCPRFKVASPEVVDYPLLEAIAETGKPALISDGMAQGSDTDRAVAVLGLGRVTILHCVSEYPASPMAFRFGDCARWACSAWGLSDHSLTPTAATVAVAMGASVVEKHLCLKRSDGGPDAGFSLEQEEFEQTVRVIRQAEAMRRPCGSGGGTSTHGWLRRSLWVVRDVQVGDIVSADNVRSLRPADGMHPFRWPAVRGRRFTQAVRANTPFVSEMI